MTNSARLLCIEKTCWLTSACVYLKCKKMLECSFKENFYLPTGFSQLSAVVYNPETSTTVAPPTVGIT